jgi:hypothetical protein
VFGALVSGCHRKRQFIIFDGARKRLERVMRMRGGQQQ